MPAALFGAVASLRGRLYDRGWLPSEHVDAPVVSVGNLTAGGTGKTPMVAWLVHALQERGRRPGIVSRGYGADADGTNDEARLLAEALPGVPHAQDPDRARGARALLAAADVLVLDDGFQHRRLARDVDLVLVDATRPWGLPAKPGEEPVCELLPRGLLREAPAALARAHAIVITRSDQVEAGELAELCTTIEREAPGVPCICAVHRPARLRSREAVYTVEQLAGASVDLVSAIGNPDAFERTVRDLGAEIVTHRRFPDHHLYAAEDLEGLGDDGRRIVTTAKDGVKLPDQPVWILDVELDLGGGAAPLHALLDALPQSLAARQRRALHEGLHG